MPKLNKAMQKEVNDAEAWAGRGIIPDGLYLARLFVVSVEPKKPGKEYGSWRWDLQLVSDLTGDEEYGGRKMVEFVSLSPNVAGKFKQIFNAFGATPDTDTDELLGSMCVLRIGHSIQTEGKNKGNERNDILEFLPADMAGDLAADPDAQNEEDF